MGIAPLIPLWFEGDEAAVSTGLYTPDTTTAETGYLYIKSSDGKFIKTSDGFFVLSSTFGRLFASDGTLPTSFTGDTTVAASAYKFIKTSDGKFIITSDGEYVLTSTLGRLFTTDDTP